jgi:hypothetical protein
MRDLECFAYTDDHIYVNLDSAIYRVISIMKTRMLDVFILASFSYENTRD